MANIAGFKKTSQLMAYLAVSFAFISPAWPIDLGGALKQIQQQIKPPASPQPQSQMQKPAAQPEVSATVQEDGIDQEYMKLYGGLYSLDCKQPDILSATLNKNSILIFVNARTITVGGLESSHTTFGNEAPSGYEITIEGNEGVSMQIFKDKKGYYAELYGSPKLEKQMGGAGKRLSYCSSSNNNTTPSQTKKIPVAQLSESKPVSTQVAQPAKSKDTIKHTEIVFSDVNEKNIDLIKQNKPLGEWVKKYIKLAKDAGAGEIKTVKGYKISDLIKVAPFSDDATTLLLRAPVIGPGFDDVLVVSRNPISANRIEHGQESKYFFVTSSVNGKNITTIRYENKGKFRHILDEDMTTEVHKTLSDCNLDEDYFKEETYAVMIAEGVLNVNGNKVLSYSTGGAPSLGHSIEIKAPLTVVEKIVRRAPPLERVKFPNFKKIPKTCTAEAKIYEQGRGITMVSCGCNVESGDSDH